MVELAILSGRRAATVVPIVRFPCVIGRAGADVSLEDPGVAAVHATLTGGGIEGFRIEAAGEATMYSGGSSQRQMRLRNGEIFEIGSVRLQFCIRPARPRNLAWMEYLAVALLGGVCAVELAWILISPAWP